MLRKILRRTSLSDSRSEHCSSSTSREGFCTGTSVGVEEQCAPSAEIRDKHSSTHWETIPEEAIEKLPECLVRSKNYSCYNGPEGVYIYEERKISFQRGPAVNVMRGKEEGCCAAGVLDYGMDYRRKRLMPTLLSQVRDSALRPGDAQKCVISSTENSDTKVEMCKAKNSDFEHPEDEESSLTAVKSEFTPLLANQTTGHSSHDVSAPIANNKLSIELETSDRLISRKMEICHNAQLIECQELCSLYETVSLLDVQMSHCKKLLTEAMACDDKEESLRCKENLLGLHFKMMTVQFHVRLHKEFLAIKEKSFQDLLSAKSCIKDTTALIACLTSSMDEARDMSRDMSRDVSRDVSCDVTCDVLRDDIKLHCMDDTIKLPDNETKLLSTSRAGVSDTSRASDLPELTQLDETTISNGHTSASTEDEDKAPGNDIPITNNSSPGDRIGCCRDGIDKADKETVDNVLHRKGAVRRRDMFSEIVSRQHTPECLTRPLGG